MQYVAFRRNLSRRIQFSRSAVLPFQRTYTSSHKSPPPSIQPLTSILIANRGEIALSVSTFDAEPGKKRDMLTMNGVRRIGKTASRYGIQTTTIYTDPDARAQHALSSPSAVNLGPASAYLDGDRIIEVAKQQGCVGVHPGYGFVCFGLETLGKRVKLLTEEIVE